MYRSIPCAPAFLFGWLAAAIGDAISTISTSPATSQSDPLPEPKTSKLTPSRGRSPSPSESVLRFPGPSAFVIVARTDQQRKQQKTKLSTTNTETLQVQTIHLPLCVYVDGCVYVFLMLPNIALYSNCPYHDNFPPNSTNKQYTLHLVLSPRAESQTKMAMALDANRCLDPRSLDLSHSLSISLSSYTRGKPHTNAIW